VFALQEKNLTRNLWTGLLISTIIISINTIPIIMARRGLVDWNRQYLWSSAMPINIPFENHGACSVALIALRSHPKRVYHYSKTTGQEESWAVRDYLTGQIVRSGDSTLTASQIEDTVEYAEKPAYRSVKLIPRWQADCRAASGNHFGAAHVDTTTPNPATLGNWQRMSSQGS